MVELCSVTAIKLPIGCGAIESRIRQIVNLQLKGDGKFWLLENVEALPLAIIKMAGTWGNWRNSILTAALYPPSPHFSALHPI